jgi:hypothetical protein
VKKINCKHFLTSALLPIIAIFSVSENAISESIDNDLSSDVTMTWVEKYVTYEQDHKGLLTLTDVHFLAEIIFEGDRDFDSIKAAAFRGDEKEPLSTYGGADKRAFTNGYFYTRKSKSFDDVDGLEALHPADSTYSWAVDGPAGKSRLAPIRIGGPEGVLQIPKVSTIRLLQGDAYVNDFLEINASQPMTIEWDPFEIGGPLVGTVWNDLVFVLISDCHGKVVYTAGAPGTDEDYADFNDTSAVVPAGQLSPGSDYAVFISLVNYVDNNNSHGITQLAANSFAVEMSVRTDGADTTDACPKPARPAQYLWTRKTVGDKMVSWPTVADHW